MKLWYIRFGNYEPEEFIAGYFISEELAEEVEEYLYKTCKGMYEVRFMETDIYFSSFAEWLKSSL